MKRHIPALFLLATLATMLYVSTTGLNDRSLICLGCRNWKTVDKLAGEDFTVEIAFKNAGETEGVWSVNIAFEGDEWTWGGTPKTLHLEPSKGAILIWGGHVPEQASPGSTSRLIVYYNWSFEPLDWWIHLVEDAELTIVSSTVE